MLEIKEMRQKDMTELEAELENTKKELFRLHCRQVTDVVQNHTAIRKLRKNIARLNTIIKEKQNAPSKTNKKQVE
jgi:large subunit ribosomal protein L29